MERVEELLGDPEIAKYLNIAFPVDMDDQRRLATLIGLTKPKAILEIGSGWSSIVLARLAVDTGAFLEILEGDPVFYASTLRALIASAIPRGSSDEIRQSRTQEWDDTEHWRLIFSPPINGNNSHSVFMGSQALHNPDFVYVDGPAVWGQRVIVENVFSPWVNPDHPMCFYVDGRLPMAASLYATYADAYGLPYNWLFSHTSNCSLVYHEQFTEAGDWFAKNHELTPLPPKVGNPPK